MARNSSINRTAITANVIVQIAALLAIVVMANYFAMRHYKRWDFSRDKKYSLSDQTKRVLATLKKPAKLTVFFSGASDIFPDVRNLVQEYAAATKMMKVEVVNPFMNLSEGIDISTRYKLGERENVVIIDYDGHTAIVNAAEMAEYEEALNPMEKPRVSAFKGEEVLTGALVQLSEQGSSKLYVLSGHGETPIDSPAVSTIKTYLERQNVKLDSLALTDTNAVPADAKALLLFGAKYDYSERDLQLLRTYWNNKGRIYLLTDPHFHLPNLAAFLDELGVTANDDMVLTTVPISDFTTVLKNITGDFIDGSPITERLRGAGAKLLGGTRSLTLNEDRVTAGSIKLHPLIKASKGFWATTRYDNSDGLHPIYFNPKLDRTSPIVAASVEKGGVSNPIIKIDSSRMVVIGNSFFIYSGANQPMVEAELDFFLNGINWLLDRDQLMGIAPKPVRSFALSLSEAEIGNLFQLTVLAIPCAAALLGFFSWWKRRK